MDTKKNKQAAFQIEAAQQTLKRELAKAKPKNHCAKPHAISPRTKLPVEHPESQAVERIHYDMQTSLNSHPDHKDED